MNHVKNGKPNIDVEVLASDTNKLSNASLLQHVQVFLNGFTEIVLYGDTLITEFHESQLGSHVCSIRICEEENIGNDNQGLLLKEANVRFHVYHLHSCEPVCEIFSNEGGEELPSANQWVLPSAEFQGLWNSLIFDSDVKAQLLNFASTSLLFSDRNVDNNIVSSNKVVLLHGPPGTGKTSLCKALAQKLCIRLSYRYKYGHLIEINSHSLFSKWFSESGKLVLKLFQSIQEFINDKDVLVIVLIDEVESLTHARKSAMAGTDPSDAIRVVNALLTQLDAIKNHSNVLILTTSNITGAIDLAFVDRADIKQYIGPPSAAAIFKIYSSCIAELMRTGIILPLETLLSWRSLQLAKFVENDATRLSLLLRNIAMKSESISGRSLRKLPLLAFALYIQSETTTLEQFLNALLKAVEKYFKDHKELSNS